MEIQLRKISPEIQRLRALVQWLRWRGIYCHVVGDGLRIHRGGVTTLLRNPKFRDVRKLVEET